MKFSKYALAVSSLVIGLLVSGCSNPLGDKDSNVEASFNPGAPGPPVTKDFSSSFNQDTDSPALNLPYTADVGILATSCAVSNLVNVTAVQSCACVAGVCSVKVRGTTFFSGPASFQFQVLDSENRASNTSTATLTIIQTNQAPTLAAIADRSTNEDAASVVALTPADLDGALTCTAANFTATSGNLTLVPNTNLVMSGTWPACALTATPAANLSGTATISLTLSDGTQSATRSFVLTVTAVNDGPTISDVTDKTTNEDTATSALPFTIGDIDSALTCGSVTGTSSNTALVPNAAILIAGTAPNCTATITPAANANGTSTITLTVSDGTLTANDTFVLTVTAVNDGPTISDVTDKTTNEDTATSALPFTIADIDSTLTCLGSVTPTSSNTTLVPNGNIVIAGTAPNCTATITPAANKFGTSTITLTVTDGTLSANDTFVLTVNSVDDVPVVPGTGTQPSINQCAATSSGSIDIPIIYDDVEGDLATACAVSAKSASLQGTAACSCTAGACKVTGLTVTSTFLNTMAVHADKDIATALTYTVTANGATSASGSVAVTVRTGTWNPNCIGTANLALWMDASDASTLFTDTAGTVAATSGSALALWKDKSGSARHAQQATATKRPIYNSSVFNSRPGVYSDGVDDQLDQLGTTSVLPNNYNIIHVFAIRYISGDGAIFDWSVVDNHSIMPDHLNYGLLVGGGSGGWIGIGGPASVRPFGTANSGTNVPTIGTMVRTSPGTHALYSNGSTTASRSQASATMTNDRYRFFGRLPTVQYNRSEVGEYVFAYNSSGAIDSTWRDRLEGYIAHKWAMTGSLPAGHTYKSYPP